MNRPTSLVVGAAGGVGLELVKLLVACGHRVLGSVLNEAEANLVRKDVPGVDLLQIDLSNADSVGPILQSLLHTLNDGLDYVAVCAAISPYGPLETTPLAQLRRTLEINTIAGLAVYQVCMPSLRRSRGRMILISSFSGKVALPFIGHYAASKFALEALIDTMRREAAQWGVEIIAIEPGGIKTSMVTNQIETIGADIAALSADTRQLYGTLYGNFAGLLQQGAETGVDPAIVAKSVVDALLATKPRPRYQVGADAEYFCNVAARLPDEELDATIKGFMAGSP